MRPYEVMVILDPALEEQAIEAQLDRSTELIRSRGGTPGRVERWGKRRLAYELRHNREGYYVLLEARAEPSTMIELDRTLHLADEVLRHKVIRLPEKVARGAARRGAPPSAEPEPGPEPPATIASEIAAPEAAPATSTSANGE